MASSFRILNSSSGTLSPPLALLAAVLPKAHLTSHCRMSGSEWETTPWWLFGSLRSFFCTVLLCILSISWSLLLLLDLYHFCLYCAHLWMKHSFDISSFLEEISSLTLSVVFFYFFALKKAFLSLLAVLCNSAFSWVHLSLSPLLFTSLLSSICKASSENHFAFLHFFFFGMVSFAASSTVSWTYAHSSSGILFTKSNPVNLFPISTAYS